MFTVRAARPLLSVLAALTAAVGLIGTTVTPAVASGATGGCNPYIDGTVIPVPCSSGSGAVGTATSGDGAGTSGSSCSTIALGSVQAHDLGLPSPPTGQSWALMQCPGGATGDVAQAVLISAAIGAPAVTPQQLLVSALAELRVPSLAPSTAPPRGHDGLVGLPEWFWIPAASWHARTLTVSAGPVWATVTAVPVRLTFQPGVGLSAVSCAGPGTAYNPRKPAAEQRTDCSYTFLQPSIGQPGNAYQASVTVSWSVSWTGSGGAGGVLDGALPVPVDFAIPVAQAEALVTSP